nr:MAG TPA: hypothetical protein [Caudoviricetes sp.]
MRLSLIACPIKQSRPLPIATAPHITTPVYSSLMFSAPFHSGEILGYFGKLYFQQFTYAVYIFHIPRLFHQKPVAYICHTFVQMLSNVLLGNLCAIHALAQCKICIHGFYLLSNRQPKVRGSVAVARSPQPFAALTGVPCMGAVNRATCLRTAPQQEKRVFGVRGAVVRKFGKCRNSKTKNLL